MSLTLLLPFIQYVGEHSWRKRNHLKTQGKLEWKPFPLKAMAPWSGCLRCDSAEPVVPWPNWHRAASPRPAAAHPLTRVHFTGNQESIFPRFLEKNFPKREKENYYIPVQIKTHRTVAGSQPNYFRPALPSAWPVNCRKIQANHFFCN